MHKVLIIEDDPPYRKIYKRKFEVSGFTVEVAENGAEGLDKLHVFQPDIVLTDLMMPVLDGFHVLDSIKSDPALRHVPVIVLTNLSTPDDTEKVLKKGAAALIVKSDTEPNDIVAKTSAILAESSKS